MDQDGVVGVAGVGVDPVLARGLVRGGGVEVPASLGRSLLGTVRGRETLEACPQLLVELDDQLLLFIWAQVFGQPSRLVTAQWIRALRVTLPQQSLQYEKRDILITASLFCQNFGKYPCNFFVFGKKPV